jgi:amino acid transporter
MPFFQKDVISTIILPNMEQLKKLMGFFWMLIAPIIIYFLITGAITNIGAGTKDINKPIPWIIIIAIFTPIAIGLMIFGWYCVKGEYNKLPESSNEIE